MSVLRKLRRLVTDQGGYNLIELLITIAILSTVVGALTVLFIQATNAEFDMNRRFQAQLAARQAIDKMRREIHCASAITPTGASTSISVTLPGQCPTAGGSQTTVTYDTAGSGQRWQLRRNSVNLADYVTTQNIFNYTAPVSGTSLGKLTVTLPINTQPANTAKQWKLVADIVLRNTTR
ncbi:MAG: prepilin-type N-terminal cleavage/methylation domain-containing protein [Actinobacteria bacterium]|nr:MAG: prepilin-type N-terminal cleavage/methylation domain-containing protein [Actinomycetota bacterium]